MPIDERLYNKKGGGAHQHKQNKAFWFSYRSLLWQFCVCPSSPKLRQGVRVPTGKAILKNIFSKDIKDGLHTAKKSATIQVHQVAETKRRETDKAVLCTTGQKLKIVRRMLSWRTEPDTELHSGEKQWKRMRIGRSICYMESNWRSPQTWNKDSLERCGCQWLFIAHKCTLTFTSFYFFHIMRRKPIHVARDRMQQSVDIGESETELGNGFCFSI